MYLSSSTHFYLFMTISCCVLITIISCDDNANNIHQQPPHIFDTSIENLPPEYNESRHSIHTISSLTVAAVDDNSSSINNETESKKITKKFYLSITICEQKEKLHIFIFFFKVQEHLALDLRKNFNLPYYRLCTSWV